LKRQVDIKAALLIFAAILAVVGLSGFFAMDALLWFSSLAWPQVQPPLWAILGAWGVAVVLWGVSAYFISQGKGDKKKFVLLLYGVCAVLCPLWSYLFFTLRQLGSAFLLLFMIWGFSLLMVVVARQVSLRASWLVFPYFLWSGIAAAIGYALVMLN
jgi:tryptophan-rich sensory protein